MPHPHDAILQSERAIPIILLGEASVKLQVAPSLMSHTMTTSFKLIEQRAAAARIAERARRYSRAICWVPVTNLKLNPLLGVNEMRAVVQQTGHGAGCP